jgi:hypothetical protein
VKHSSGLELVLLLLVFGAVSTGSAMAQRSGHPGGPGGGAGRGGGSGHIGGPGHGSGPSHGSGPGHVSGPSHGVGGYGHGYHYGYSIAFGFPYYWPGYYYYGYYPYYPYAYSEPAAPPAEYIERGASQAAPAQPQADWFYCAKSNAYYPYVRECPAGWQRVPSTPPR